MENLLLNTSAQVAQTLHLLVFFLGGGFVLGEGGMFLSLLLSS